MEWIEVIEVVSVYAVQEWLSYPFVDGFLTCDTGQMLLECQMWFMAAHSLRPLVNEVRSA